MEVCKDRGPAGVSIVLEERLGLCQDWRGTDILGSHHHLGRTISTLTVVIGIPVPCATTMDQHLSPRRSPHIVPLDCRYLGLAEGDVGDRGGNEDRMDALARLGS